MPPHVAVLLKIVYALPAKMSRNILLSRLKQFSLRAESGNAKVQRKKCARATAADGTLRALCESTATSATAWGAIAGMTDIAAGITAAPTKTSTL